MSPKRLLAELRKLSAGDGFCQGCMVTHFRTMDDPRRPEVCPKCGRGPGDYHPQMVREFVIRRPAVYGLKELAASPEPDGLREGMVPG